MLKRPKKITKGFIDEIWRGYLDMDRLVVVAAHSAHV